MVSIVEFTGDGACMGRRPSTIPTCQWLSERVESLEWLLTLPWFRLDPNSGYFLLWSMYCIGQTWSSFTFDHLNVFNFSWFILVLLHTSKESSYMTGSPVRCLDVSAVRSAWMCRNTELAKIILFWKYLDTSRSRSIGQRAGKVLIWYKRLWSQVVGPCFVWLLLSLFTPCLLPNDPTDMINNDKHQRWEFHLVFFLGGGVCQFENDDQSCVPLQQEVVHRSHVTMNFRWEVSRCGAVLGDVAKGADFVSVRKKPE